MRRAGLYQEPRTTRASIDILEQHGACSHKTATGVEPPPPGLKTDTAGTLNIDAPETRRHGMHAVVRAGTRSQPEAAIEQCVIVAAADLYPLAVVTRPALTWRAHEVIRC